MRLLAAIITAFLSVVWPLAGIAQPMEASVAPLNAQVFVFGHQVRFSRLATSRAQPVVSVDDPGLASALSLIGARLQFQPGTRFLVFARADGKLVTFTVGSNAVSVDNSSTAIPFGPFYVTNQLYVPLLALAQALGLHERGFHGDYVFSPQITSVVSHIGQRRTIVEVAGTAPLVWRSAYGGSSKQPTLTVEFPGFANAAGSKITLGDREAKAVTIEQQGPPGYPITSLHLDVMHGVKFASHRNPNDGSMDLVLARSESDLALRDAAFTPSVQLSTPPKPAPTATPTPTPTPPPLPAPSTLVPTAVPAPEMTDNGASPQPTGSGLQPQAGPSPLQKITDVFVTDAQDASRITLALTGPVSFEWHRLAPPDNRFWIDISQAALVGPARDVVVKLAQVRSVKLSQHEIAPDHVVRVSIEPTQPVDIVIGAIEGTPNQLGIEIRSSPPPADAASSGVGLLPVPSAQPSAQPQVAVTRGPERPNLIVIDAGHGGNDPGAMNQQYGLVESHLTLDIAQHLKSDLERGGWRVVLTRDGDYEVGDPNGDDHQELQARCDIANAAGARLFISVHINSSVSSEPNGITTYFWHPGDRVFAQAIQTATVRASGAGDDGVIRENFYVVHHADMPAVLVENAYLSNPHDAQMLTQQSFIDKLAAGIAQGVKDYTGGPPAQ